MRFGPIGNANSLLAKGEARLGLLLSLALVIFALVVMPPAMARAQDFDGTGNGSTTPSFRFTPCSVCSTGCPSACPLPSSSTAPAAPSYNSPSGGGFTPQQQMMLQGAYGTGQVLGYALGRAIHKAIVGDPEQARLEAIRKAQEEAARQSAEAAAEAARKAEEDRRHQELMTNLKDIDGIGAAGEQVRLKGLDDASGGEQVRPKSIDDASGTGSLQLKTGNDLFGANPPPQADASAVDLRGAGTRVDPSVVKQGGPCPLDANGMPECGAPAGEQAPSASADALQQYNKYNPSNVAAPPSPPQSAYDNGLSGRARQDAAARSANQASSQEFEDVGQEGPAAERATVNAAKVAVHAAEGAEAGSEAGPAGAVGGAAIGTGVGVYENYKDNDGK